MDPRIVAEKITEEASNQSDSADSEVKVDTIENKTYLTTSALDIESQNGSHHQNSISSTSLPASRKSTLKRPNRKKRNSVDSAENKTSGSGTGSSSLSKPVLISDRDYDVASAIAAQRRYK